MTDAAQERALDAPWDEEAMRAASKEDREMDKMLKDAKNMGFSDDSDDSSTHNTFHFNFEDPAKLAKARKLFNKTNTNGSVSTFNTHDNTLAENKNTRDEVSIVSTNPSPTKRSRVRTHSDDVSMSSPTTPPNDTRIEAVESGLSNLNDMMTAFFKSQNFLYQGTNLTEDIDKASQDEDSERHLEASLIVPETPEAFSAPGASL